MKLGIDAGAYSVKLLLVDQENKVIFKKEQAHHNKVKETVLLLFKDLEENVENLSELEVAATGSMGHLLNLPEEANVPSLLALKNGGLRLAGQAESIICLGARKTYYLEKDFDFAINFNSSEENTAIVLKQLIDGNRKQLPVPLLEFDLDYEHGASREDYM